MSSSVAVGGGNTGPTNELSPNAWSGHSFPHEIGDDNASAPFHREPHEDNYPQPEHSAMVMDDATTKMDLQFDAKAPSRPSFDIAAAIAAIAPSTVTTVGVVTIDYIEPRLYDGGNEGGGTSEGSKKKESVFLEGVPLVDLDDYDVLD